MKFLQAQALLQHPGTHIAQDSYILLGAESHCAELTQLTPQDLIPTEQPSTKSVFHLVHTGASSGLVIPALSLINIPFFAIEKQG